MLSYHAISVPQAPHAERGRTIERRSGTRAATTLRKLPIARPGTKTSAAKRGGTVTAPLARDAKRAGSLLGRRGLLGLRLFLFRRLCLCFECEGLAHLPLVIEGDHEVVPVRRDACGKIRV